MLSKHCFLSYVIVALVGRISGIRGVRLGVGGVSAVSGNNGDQCGNDEELHKKTVLILGFTMFFNVQYLHVADLFVCCQSN